ncbi:PREDICTED: EF-hand calcium-binding domain-containing protein 1-like [Trachymyrmex cornetzi]|uniref:EF-hand calcium-binding domain-containing protein 1 n=1 Tax=Trachymyrmex cornetzi TaxID=471704 RepID=A0A195DKM0_9HYME|nr:PREDICTED: EF-hand calcium-binding domain-containing protein 1-like [Trachymyrmex cornetzi]XP_018371603.1 PREDICTED: EF-hand calcium-binding domain-containing protein 1-like [Trachymyrmex cornetzi]XP_018371604.1 PREDICTED: EF-hand calcium-binding domain-containing protein 1-like [Trachymyrmex cornetzi]KYN13396.1 EF-hand calcium-binding domain-containing protein 1 [Trachymyrmex cornetzi]
MPVELPVDMLNKPLSEIVFRRKNNALFKKLARKTHFNVREVEALAVIHRKITQTLGPMTRSVFRDVLHSGLDFTENIRHLYIDRIFSAFDKKNVLQIHLEQWIEGLSTILRGNLNEKIHFAFSIYDFMHTNKLKKEQIFPSMRGCLIKLQTDEDPDEAVKDLIDSLLKKLDVDRDGVISEEEFYRAVKERNLLLLESLGPVFPSRVARRTFLSTFTDRLGRF